jgi:hypothetical protein
MGIEEQDLILGRLTRESKELQRTIAAIESKLQAWCSALNDVANKTDATCSPLSELDSMDIALASLSQLPERRELAETLNDLQRNRNRLVQIKRQLSLMD